MYEVYVTESEGGVLNQELTFPVPWGIISAKTWGDPCQHPVLVVHGIQDNAGSFDRLIPLLPKFFYYVCIDLPGHGKSTRFPKGVRLDLLLYISAVHRVVQNLRWNKFYYIGHSLGGQLGTYYAAMYPDKVAKLIVLDAISPFVLQMEEYLPYHIKMTDKIIELESKMLDKTPPSYTYEEALKRMIENRPSPITKDAAEALLKRSLKNGPNGYYFSTDQRLKFAVISPMSPEQHLFNMSHIQCPFLLVMTKILKHFAEKTFNNRSNLESRVFEVYKNNPNFQTVLVEGYHDVHNNEPHVVAPIVSNFLFEQKSML